MERVILKELFKKFEFDLTIKWYMQNQEPVKENKTHISLEFLDKKMDPLISTRRLDFVILNKKREPAK